MLSSVINVLKPFLYISRKKKKKAGAGGEKKPPKAREHITEADILMQLSNRTEFVFYYISFERKETI